MAGGNLQRSKMGNYMEEVWSNPHVNNLIGMFRMMKGDNIIFTELIYIDEINGKTAMRLKHFDEMLAGREAADKTVDFPFISQTEKNSILRNGL